MSEIASPTSHTQQEAEVGARAQAWDEGWRQGAWDVEENGWESHDLSKGPHPANPYRADALAADTGSAEG